jgi:hypothetical protein
MGRSWAKDRRGSSASGPQRAVMFHTRAEPPLVTRNPRLRDDWRDPSAE